MEGAPALVKQLGRIARSLGHALEHEGIFLQGKAAPIERCEWRAAAV